MIFNNQNIQVADVSVWQAIIYENGRLLSPEQRKYIDFQKMKDYGTKAAVIKCGQNTYKDPVFDEHWIRAKAVGLPRASYWFCDYRTNGRDQARTYWNFIKHDIGEGFLCADWEHGAWTDWQQLYAFLAELQQLSQLPSEKIFIYVGYYFWLEHRPTLQYQANWFNQFPLWMPAYTDPKYVEFVKGIAEWGYTCRMWQWGTPSWGKANGCWSEEIDMNLINGGTNAFEKIFGTGGIVIPPPQSVFPYSIKIGNREYR